MPHRIVVRSVLPFLEREARARPRPPFSLPLFPSSSHSEILTLYRATRLSGVRAHRPSCDCCPWGTLLALEIQTSLRCCETKPLLASTTAVLTARESSLTTKYVNPQRRPRRFRRPFARCTGHRHLHERCCWNPQQQPRRCRRPATNGRRQQRRPGVRGGRGGGGS